MKSILFLSTILLCSSAIATDYSDLKAYEIEIVIFEQIDGKSASSEIWPDLVKKNTEEPVIDLHYNSSITQEPGPEEKAYYYSILRDDKLQLKSHIEKLTNSDNYNVLYHKGWIQPGLNAETAESIRISTNQAGLPDNTMPVINALEDLSASEMMSPEAPVLLSSKNEKAKLEGTVKIVLGRYLHVNFDLILKRNLAPKDGIIETGADMKEDNRFYPIQTHRRMRSKETHYIDHPLIGVLVLATPFKLPEPDQPEEEYKPGLFKLDSLKVN